MNQEKLSPYELWQLERYGKIVDRETPTTAEEEFESGIADIERLAEWIDAQTEQQLLNH